MSCEGDVQFSPYLAVVFNATRHEQGEKDWGWHLSWFVSITPHCISAQEHLHWGPEVTGLNAAEEET